MSGVPVEQRDRRFCHFLVEYFCVERFAIVRDLVYQSGLGFFQFRDGIEKMLYFGSILAASMSPTTITQIRAVEIVVISP